MQILRLIKPKLSSRHVDLCELRRDDVGYYWFSLTSYPSHLGYCVLGSTLDIPYLGIREPVGPKTYRFDEADLEESYGNL